jgi:hypothetical protein
LRFSRSAAPKRRCCFAFSAAFGRSFMRARLRSRAAAGKPDGRCTARACAVSGLVARIAALAAAFHVRFPHPARRCRSSVVEHPLGKGEVVSSILTGSTRKSGISRNDARQNRAEQSTTRRAKTHQISTKRSTDVHAAERDEAQAAYRRRLFSTMRSPRKKSTTANVRASGAEPLSYRRRHESSDYARLGVTAMFPAPRRECDGHRRRRY